MLQHVAALLAGTELRWWDVLDILIVAFIVYELLQFIRGTHAVQIALGGLVLVVLYWTLACSSTCRPSTGCCGHSCRSWCSASSWCSRRRSARASPTSAGRRSSEAPRGGARRRSSTRWCWPRPASPPSAPGAIIVLEREMGLRSYIETGIALDAVVTYDLLVSIFHPATPLHDGAVVIQGNRVAAAACFLPLTVNPELSRTLGSRHRAAIGLTEDTDAVAVVVSEETGTISVVEGGRIRRGLDGPALQQDLLSSLGLGAREPAPPAEPEAEAEVGRETDA